MKDGSAVKKQKCVFDNTDNSSRINWLKVTQVIFAGQIFIQGTQEYVCQPKNLQSYSLKCYLKLRLMVAPKTEIVTIINVPIQSWPKK